MYDVFCDLLNFSDFSDFSAFSPASSLLLFDVSVTIAADAATSSLFSLTSFCAFVSLLDAMTSVQPDGTILVKKKEKRHQKKMFTKNSSVQINYAYLSYFTYSKFPSGVYVSRRKNVCNVSSWKRRIFLLYNGDDASTGYIDLLIRRCTLPVFASYVRSVLQAKQVSTS